LVLGFFSQPMGELQTVSIGGIDFLNRDDIGIQFANDVTDARRIVSPVAADASMDIIGGERQAHIRPLTPGPGFPAVGRTATVPTPIRSARCRQRSSPEAEHCRCRDDGWFQSPDPGTARAR